MGQVQEYVEIIDKLKAKKGFSKDLELAQHYSIAPSQISRWKEGQMPIS